MRAYSCKHRRDAYRAAPRLMILLILVLPALFLLACEENVVQTGTKPNPVPDLDTLSPDWATVGGPSFVLTLTGSNFIEGSVVIWNGAERATEYVSSTEINATILELDISAAMVTAGNAPEPADTADGAGMPADRTIQVWVRNPEPGGGTSNALSFSVLDVRPVPQISSISPSTSVVGGPELTINVYGSAFHLESVVRWDQTDLATTYLGQGHLTAVIPAANLAVVTSASITVFTPEPGGGTSNSRTFQVIPPNPVPVVTDISPSTVTAGGAGGGSFVLTVTGTGFVSSSVVLWDGEERSTTYISETSLQATIPALDIVDGGTAVISVFNPPPGGGLSGELALSIENPVPAIVAVTPSSAAAGTPGATLKIDGSGFVPSSVARWDGADRPTTFLSHNDVEVSVTAADVQDMGKATLVVYNPAPAGGLSSEFLFTIYRSVSIKTNDIIYDPTSGNIFASVPSDGGGIGNTITAIDPDTGQLISSVFVGSEPDPMAISDDGQYVYVGLTGASAIRRYVIATETADIQFEVGTDPFYGPFYAEDIVVLSGAPGTVAASAVRPGVSPRHGGVFIYDDGVRRPKGTQDHTGSNRIEPSAFPNILYGYNNETTEFGFRQLTVDATGVTETQVQRDLISGFGVDITYSGGKVFATTGVIIDPVNMRQLGTVAASGPVAPDASINRVFLFGGSQFGRNSIVVFDTETFTKVGEVEIEAIGGSSQSLIRVGSDGLAFRADGSTVVIVRHPLFAAP